MTAKNSSSGRSKVSPHACASRSARACAAPRPRRNKRKSCATCNEFPGHIACDAASQSEIVVPLFEGEKLIGVWDVDSPTTARFDEDDRVGMERLASIFVESIRAGNA